MPDSEILDHYHGPDRRTFLEWSASRHPEPSWVRHDSGAIQLFDLGDPEVYRLRDYVVSSRVSGPSIILCPIVRP